MRQREYQIKNKALGLCVTCGNNSRPNKVNCQRCADKRKNRKINKEYMKKYLAKYRKDNKDILIEKYKNKMGYPKGHILERGRPIKALST